MNRYAVIAIVLGLLVAGGFLRGPLEEIHIPAGKLASIAGIFPITNTLLATWVTMAVIAGLFYKATSGFNYERMSMIPRGVQNFIELAMEGLLNFVIGVAGPEKARQFFPVVGAIFLFVIGNAWLGLLPGYLTIGAIQEPHEGQKAHHFNEYNLGLLKIGVVPFGSGSASHDAPAAHAATIAPEDGAAVPAAEEPVGLSGAFTPILRAANTDLNTTLALALVAMFFVEMWGLKALGLGYIGKFINFSGPIGLFVGLLELVSEFARIISFTFRLFGNMFAGEVLLGVITFLVPWVLVLPFLGLEIFVGFVQALVFAGLTLVFGVMATTGHAEEHHEEAGHGPAAEAAHH